MTHEPHERPWHPGESPEHIQRAVQRVRERNGMSTREAREQFRERIQGVLTGAEREYESREQFRMKLDEVYCTAPGSRRDAAVAVYAQALRDVADALGDIRCAHDEIRAFAADRGIELGEGCSDVA